jgi:hypothetical protein
MTTTHAYHTASPAQYEPGLGKRLRTARERAPHRRGAHTSHATHASTVRAWSWQKNQDTTRARTHTEGTGGHKHALHHALPHTPPEMSNSSQLEGAPTGSTGERAASPNQTSPLNGGVSLANQFAPLDGPPAVSLEHLPHSGSSAGLGGNSTNGSGTPHASHSAHESNNSRGSHLTNGSDRPHDSRDSRSNHQNDRSNRPRDNGDSQGNGDYRGNKTHAAEETIEARGTRTTTTPRTKEGTHAVGKVPTPRTIPAATGIPAAANARRTTVVEDPRRRTSGSTAPAGTST